MLADFAFRKRTVSALTFLFSFGAILLPPAVLPQSFLNIINKNGSRNEYRTKNEQSEHENDDDEQSCAEIDKDCSEQFKGIEAVVYSLFQSLNDREDNRDEDSKPSDDYQEFGIGKTGIFSFI